ncbi:MAG: FAD-binding oxidoreductase [Streptosporangiaceae bacterium]
MTDVSTRAGGPAAGGSAAQHHAAAVEAIQRAYAAIPAGQPVRLAKTTSNLFRFRADPAGHRLDAAPFSRVICVDPQTQTARVGGTTTYEDLVAATLRHGLMPLVVPELKTITLGGAVSGLGVESTSLRNGLPHESVIALEILTGDGQVVTATKDNEHAALYRGFPNSYGTLGYTLSLTIELQPVRPYVHLRHFGFTDPDECFAAVEQVAADGSYRGHRADFIDGTAFGPGEMYLSIGAFSDVAPWRSDYTRAKVYYQSIRGPKEDFLTIADYLWRWDTDWFWCSRAFGVQHPAVRALWPRRYRRSDVYRKLVALDRKYRVTSQVDARRGRPEREMVVQDVEIPVEQSASFLQYFLTEVGMTPVWMCPLRLRGDASWPLYPMRPGQAYVNFGFWGMVALPPGAADGHFNRRIEDKVAELGGHKGLYSTAFYSREEFWAHYNGEQYAQLKATYDGHGRLADLYDKCVRGV